MEFNHAVPYAAKHLISISLEKPAHVFCVNLKRKGFVNSSNNNINLSSLTASRSDNKLLRQNATASCANSANKGVNASERNTFRRLGKRFAIALRPRKCQRHSNKNVVR